MRADPGQPGVCPGSDTQQGGVNTASICLTSGFLPPTTWGMQSLWWRLRGRGFSGDDHHPTELHCPRCHHTPFPQKRVRSEPTAASAALSSQSLLRLILKQFHHWLICLSIQSHFGQKQAEKRFQLGFCPFGRGALQHTHTSSVSMSGNSSAFAVQSNPRQEGKEDLHSHRNLQEPRAQNLSGNKLEKRH